MNDLGFDSWGNFGGLGSVLGISSPSTTTGTGSGAAAPASSGTSFWSTLVSSATDAYKSFTGASASKNTAAATASTSVVKIVLIGAGVLLGLGLIVFVVAEIFGRRNRGN